MYYQPQPVNPEDLDLMNRIDRIHTDWPVYGARKIAAQLKRDTGMVIGRKRARSLMEIMGIEAIYPKPNLSQNNTPHPVYQYLLSGVSITRPNQVWEAERNIGAYINRYNNERLHEALGYKTPAEIYFGN